MSAPPAARSAARSRPTPSPARSWPSAGSEQPPPRDDRRADRRRHGAQLRRPTRSPTPAAAPPRPAPRSAPRSETMVPLSAFAHFGPGNTPLAVNHQGLFVATHDLVQSAARRLARARRRRRSTTQMRQLGVPASIHGSFQGTAQVFQQSLANEPLLIARRAARRLHRARHSLRELRPSDHDPLDPAVGRRRRGAGAAASSTPSSASSR